MKLYQISILLVTLLTACTREPAAVVESEHVELPPAAYEVVAAVREDGFAALAAQTDLVVPEKIDVIQGAVGKRGGLTVFFDETICRYRGGSDGTFYRFESCHDRRGALLDLGANEPVFTRGAIKVRLDSGSAQATQVRAVIQVVI